MRSISLAALLFGCILAPNFLIAQSASEPTQDVSLPNTGLVFELENVNGAPTPVRLNASEVLSNAHAGSNFARSMVYAGAHSSVELSGLHADRSLSTKAPVFYLRLSSEDPDIEREQTSLVRLKPNKNTRTVLSFSQNIFGGSRKRHADEVPIVKTNIDGSAVLKVVPEKPLEPGEYGIMFLPKDPMQFSTLVYDFSVPDTK